MYIDIKLTIYEYVAILFNLFFLLLLTYFKTHIFTRIKMANFYGTVFVVVVS